MKEITSIEIVLIEKVVEILQLNRDKISKEENLGLLGLDSMNCVNLVVELEETFDIVFEDEELLFDNFSTIDKILKILITKLVKNV